MNWIDQVTMLTQRDPLVSWSTSLCVQVNNSTVFWMQVTAIYRLDLLMPVWSHDKQRLCVTEGDRVWLLTSQNIWLFPEGKRCL